VTLEQRPVIHDAVITSLVGSTFLSRGRTYSRKGAVFGVEWNPALLLEIRKGPAMEQPPLLAVQSLPTVAPVAEPAPAS
jgi:hypothetical protein